MNELTLGESVKWLEENARHLVRESLREMPGGLHAFPPQVGAGYEAFWLRDYSYMLETCVDAFTHLELREACRLFVDKISDEGDGVDCVRFSGEPIYMPGYGRMGSKPVADGGPFTVNVAWWTWRQTKNKELLAGIMDDLARTLKAAPLNPKTGLITISDAPGQDRCPYGFTDAIGKRGDELFCSLLYFQAAGRLADLFAELGRDEETQRWREIQRKTKSAIGTVFWDAEAGLFLAATEKCRQPDIWGSAFAIWLGVATSGQALQISRYFQRHHSALCQNGQIRHLPGGTYWESTPIPRDEYQNGAFWATPSGWFVHTLALVDPALAERTVIDLVADFRNRGVFEWTIGERTRLPGYVASATMPLQGIREFATKINR
jgi:hypothetical protein